MDYLAALLANHFANGLRSFHVFLELFVRFRLEGKVNPLDVTQTIVRAVEFGCSVFALETLEALSFRGPVVGPSLALLFFEGQNLFH